MADKKGSILKDSAVGTFLVGFAVVVVGLVVTVTSDEFCRAYENSSPTSQNQNDAYYSAQYTRVLGGLTAGITILYLGWVFIDARHKDKRPLSAFDAYRLQASRIHAKRQHVQKLSVFQVVLLIAWIPPAFILAFKGWMYRGRDNVHKVRQGSVCNSSNTDRCEQLKTAGISVLVETILLLFAVILTIIPLIAKKKIPPPLPEKEMREKIAKDDEEKKKKEAAENLAAENRIRAGLGLPPKPESGTDPVDFDRMKRRLNRAYGDRLPRRRGGVFLPTHGPYAPPPPSPYAPYIGGYPAYGYGPPPPGPPPGWGGGGGGYSGGSGLAGGTNGGGGGGTNIVGFGFPMPGVQQSPMRARRPRQAPRHRLRRPPPPPPPVNSRASGYTTSTSTGTRSSLRSYPSPSGSSLSPSQLGAALRRNRPGGWARRYH